VSGILRTFLLLIVAGLAVVLGIQNSQILSQDFSLRFSAGVASWASRSVPLWLVLLIVFGVGVLLGGTSLLVDYVRVRRQLARERARADEAVRERDEAARRADEALRRATDAEQRVERLPEESTVDTIDDLEPLDDDPDSTALAPRSSRRTTGGYE
jgi:hypothetical protein